MEGLPSGADASRGRTLDADVVGSTVCGIRVTEVLPESGLWAEKVLMEGVCLLTARPVCLPLPGAPALVRGKDEADRADVDCCRLVASTEPILVTGGFNWEVSVLTRTIVSRLSRLQLGSTCAVDGKGIAASAPITWRGPIAHLKACHTGCEVINKPIRTEMGGEFATATFPILVALLRVSKGTL